MGQNKPKEYITKKLEVEDSKDDFIRRLKY